MDSRKRIIELCNETGISRRKVASYLGVQSSNLSKALRGLKTICDEDLESAVVWLEEQKAHPPASPEELTGLHEGPRSESLAPCLEALAAAVERNAPIAIQCSTLTPLALETIAFALAGARVPGSSMKAAEMILNFSYGKPQTSKDSLDEKPPAIDTLREVLYRIEGHIKPEESK